MDDGGNILVAVQVATPIVVGTVGYLIKRAIGEMDRRQTRTEARVERLEENTVDKEDWLRESGFARQRQEKIIEQLAELKARSDYGAEIAAAMNRGPHGS